MNLNLLPETSSLATHTHALSQSLSCGSGTRPIHLHYTFTCLDEQVIPTNLTTVIHQRSCSSGHHLGCLLLIPVWLSFYLSHILHFSDWLILQWHPETASSASLGKVPDIKAAEPVSIPLSRGGEYECLSRLYIFFFS